MNIKKEQTIDMYIQKITRYSTYVDCFSRLINEFTENGNINLAPSDMPNLTELNSIIANRLKKVILKMKSDWEFMK